MDNWFSSTRRPPPAHHQQLEIFLDKLCNQLRTPHFVGLEECKRVEYLSTILELRCCCKMIRLFIDMVTKWSDADKVFQNCTSLVVKVKAKADELAQRLISTSSRSSSFRKMMNEFDHQKRMLRSSDFFRLRISTVVESMSRSVSPVKIHSPLNHDLSLWIKFAESVVEIEKLWSELDFTTPEDWIPGMLSPLKQLASFIHSVHQAGFKSMMLLTRINSISAGDVKVVIEGFFAHVAAVVFRVACRLCFLIVKNPSTVAELRKLLDEISFANPKFLDITLNFLKALSEIGDHPTRVSQSDLAEFFLSSFMVENNSKSAPFFGKKLTEMVIYLNDDDPINEENKCHSAETKQLILEAVPALSVEIDSSCLIVGRMIWLSRVDLFLVEKQLSIEKIFKNPAEDQIDYLVNCLNELEISYNVQRATDDKSLYQSLCDKKIDQNMVRISISQLLAKVALLRAKQALMKLLYLDRIVIAHCKNELLFLLEHIKFFISAVTIVEVEDTVDEEKMFVCIQSVSMRIIYLHHSFLAKQLTEDTTKNTVDLLNEVRILKRQPLLKIPKSNFPNRSPGVGFLDRLLRNRLELLKHKSDTFFRDHLEEFQMELESFRSYVREAQQEEYELSEWKDLGAHVTKFIYELEHVIDSTEVGIGTQLQHMLWINNLHRQIISIKMLQAKKLHEKTQEDRGHHIPNNSSSIARAGKLEIDKLVVCLRDQEEVIIDRLTRGFSRRDVVSVVGMPGLGKTTLARKVYDDPKVSYHFHRRAWCFVSQSYVKRDLLLTLLGDIQGQNDEIYEMDDGDLELKLWQLLKGNRYLIVMDDVWDVGAWAALQTSFPNDGNGSRIMITSRQCKVTWDAIPGSNPHQLRPLSGDENWKLLEKRIFHEEGCCPDELVQVGKEIAIQCNGLALAVAAVAGMLENTKKKQESWQCILNELNARVLDDPQTQCKSILEMSYNHLPDHLKACFMYFGAFQQDRDVQVKKLIRMWIAEGFIQKTEQKSLEEEGEDLLMDLIDRSLVMVSQRKSTGGVKACQMHDLLRDLCLSKSKEENFLQLITRYDEPYASFQDLYDGVDFDYDDLSHLANYESYRVFIHLKRKHFVDSRPSGPWTRSLIFIASNDAYTRRPYNISFIYENFKLLRVLDLECINMGISFPIAIECLILLRYLALSGDLNSIPESISKLWKLETFIVKGLSGKVVLPDTFWSMTSLRHVHVKNQAAFNLLGCEFGNSLALDNLVTFSSPFLSYGKDTEKILRKLPNLFKLSCIFLESRNSSVKCNPFPTLGFLTHLESLNILYAGRERNFGELNLPLNLRKLTLSRFRLSWNHMSTIGRLPNLEVLKLLSGSLEGLTWDMKEEEFRQLKFLKLDFLNIIRWNASSDHLPRLERLVLWNCGDLEAIPFEFCEICTLQIIEVQRCSQSLEESIRRIENSVEGLQVLISK